MLMLAQLGTPGGETVPQLPDPPALAYYIFENPWLLTIGLGICGLVAMLVLRRRGQWREGRTLFICAAVLAALVMGLGLGVTTQRETLRARTRELVDLAAAAKTTDLRALLTEQARIGVFSNHFLGVRGREEVLKEVQTNLGDTYPLESHEIGPVQAVIDGPNVARTQVRVWVKPQKDQQLYGVATGAWFRIDWKRVEHGPWKVVAITIMQIDGLGLNADMGR